MCQNTTMRVNGAWIKIYCVLCSKTYNTLQSCHNFPAGSRQAARGARISETSLLQQEKNFHLIWMMIGNVLVKWTSVQSMLFSYNSFMQNIPQIIQMVFILLCLVINSFHPFPPGLLYHWHWGQSYTCPSVSNATLKNIGKPINPSHAGTKSFRFNIVNIMVADALAPCVAKSSAAMILMI